jgi:hypothetical protein
MPGCTTDGRSVSVAISTPAMMVSSAACDASGARSSSRGSSPVALLNDDTTEVGAVHLGVVFVADAEGRPVEVRETHKLAGAFASGAECAAVADRMETWSRLVFEALEAPGSLAAVAAPLESDPALPASREAS